MAKLDSNPAMEAPDPSLKLPRFQPAFLELVYKGVSGGDDAGAAKAAPTDDKPFAMMAVAKHRCVTADDAVKRTIDVTLRFEDPEAKFDYQPGDTFGLACPNSVAAVDAVLAQVDCGSAGPDSPFTLQIMADTKKRGAAIPKHFVGHTANTVRQALLVYCDLRAVLTKSALRILADYAYEAKDRHHLLQLCSRQGAEEYKKLCGEEGCSIQAVLTAHPSCKPPAGRLLEVLPCLSPRRYSAASSPLRDDNSLRLILNVVDRGLCSTWLDALGQGAATGAKAGVAAATSTGTPTPTSTVRQRAFANLLQGTPGCAAANLVPVYSCNTDRLASNSRDVVHFNPPADTKTPIILIATGTGLAPFMGFLEHRQCQRKATPDADFGGIHLFFGCRHEARDFLCRDELEAYVADGTVAQLHVAFSRDPDSPAKYVQEKVSAAGEEVIKLVQDEGGVIYICGNSNGVVDAVGNTITALLQKTCSMSQEQARTTKIGWKERGQLRVEHFAG